MSTDEQTPKKVSFFKKPFGMVLGAIGIIASTSSVVSLVMGWVNPEPTLADIADQQNQLVAAIDGGGHAVNQVSTHVTELSDQYKRILAGFKDVQRLDKSLTKSANKGKILTPAQKRRVEASRAKELEELEALVDKTEGMAETFIDAMEEDDVQEALEADGPEAKALKARVAKQLAKVKDEVLPALAKIRETHAG